ncbi:hypothetical protein C8J57DRAFT_1324430, partial [Mycena rebaudengoi]
MPIHPALRREALAGLPMTLRRLANAAMDHSETGATEIEGFAQLMRSVPEQHLFLTLPVLYESLNPTKIPAALPDRISPASSVAFSAVLQAIMALGKFPSIPLTPLESYPDLWTHAWPWMLFLHENREGLPRPFISQATELYCMFLNVIVHFQSEGGHAAVIGSTPGVRETAAHTWTVVQEIPNGEGLTDLCYFLRYDQGI